MRAFHLVELDQRRRYQKASCSSAIQYAERKFGIQRRTARELRAVGRELLELPLVDQAFRDGSINWSKTLLLTRICVPKTQATFQKFADESGERPSSGEVVRRLCELYLPTREGGSLEGRKPVHESSYHPEVDVKASGEATVRTEEGPVPPQKNVFERMACDGAEHNGATRGQPPERRSCATTGVGRVGWPSREDGSGDLGEVLAADPAGPDDGEIQVHSGVRGEGLLWKAAHTIARARFCSLRLEREELIQSLVVGVQLFRVLDLAIPRQQQ